MSTAETRFFHQAMSLIPLMAEMHFPVAEKHSFLPNMVDLLIQKIAKSLRDPMTASLYKSLTDYQMRLVEYRERVIISKEHLELEKGGFHIPLPIHLVKQFQALLPVQLSTPKLTELRQKIEKMLADYDWSPLRRKLNLVIRRIDDLVDKLKNKTKLDRDIERIGLTNLIKQLNHPSVEDIAKLPIHIEFRNAAYCGDVRKVREMILKNPDIIFSAANKEGVPFFPWLCQTFSDFDDRKIKYESQKKDRLYGHYSFHKRKLDVVKLVLRAGANVNPIIVLDNGLRWSFSPLESTCYAHHKDLDEPVPPSGCYHRSIIKMILEEGADPNLSITLAFQAMDMARVDVNSDREGIFYLLISGGLNINTLQITEQKMTVKTNKTAIKANINTLFSLACEEVVSHFALNCRNDHLTFLRTLVYNNAIVFPGALAGVPEEGLNNIKYAQQIQKFCAKRGEDNIVDSFKGCRAVAQLVLSYISTSHWCEELEEERINNFNTIHKLSEDASQFLELTRKDPGMLKEMAQLQYNNSGAYLLENAAKMREAAAILERMASATSPPPGFKKQDNSKKQ